MRTVLAISLLIVTLLIVAPSAVADSQWVKYPGNPVLGPTAGSWDAWGVNEPRVLYDGHSFKMWYNGFPTRESWEGSEGKIGYATSTDGLTWTKNTDAVIVPGPSGSWDSKGVEPGSVIWNGTHYLMWYGNYVANTQSNEGFGLAVSSDGVSWTKYSGNPVLRADAAPYQGPIAYPYVIKDGDTFKMWYSGRTSGLCYNRIYYATSPDGIKWTKTRNPVLEPRNTWDSTCVYSPTVVKNESTYLMWYTGVNSSAESGIGYATSNDGITWTRSPDNLILSTGQPGSWDSFSGTHYSGAGNTGVGEQDVVVVGNSAKLYYSAAQEQGNNITSFKIGLAQSPAGFPIPEMPSSVATLVAVFLVVATTLGVFRFSKLTEGRCEKSPESYDHS